jgi:hypothetical protein
MKRHWKLALASLMVVLLGIRGVGYCRGARRDRKSGSNRRISGPVGPGRCSRDQHAQGHGGLPELDQLPKGGVNGRKIKLIVEDDGFQPSRSIAATKKLIEQDKVFALVGTLGTPGVQATIDYIQSKKVPSIYHGSGISELAFPPKKYFLPGAAQLHKRGPHYRPVRRARARVQEDRSGVRAD